MRAVVAAVALMLALAAGCSSDEYGPVGGELPLDVVQDSLLVELNVLPLESTTIEPELDESLAERDLLYFGRRIDTGWSAVPLFRFDLSTVPDTVDVSVDNIKRASLVWHLLENDGTSEIGNLEIAIYELADTLDVDAIDGELASLLGPQLQLVSLGTYATTLSLDLDKTLVSEWLSQGDHKGIAVVDESPAPERGGAPTDSTLVGMASKDFEGATDPFGPVSSVFPEITVELNDEDNTFLNIFPKEDVTHFTRPDSGDRPVVSAHAVTRSWLRFEFDEIPTIATINQAILELELDPMASLGADSSLSAFTVETRTASRAEAESGDLTTADTIPRGSNNLQPLESTQFRLDVTDFVQRAVNGALETDGSGNLIDGILISLFQERFRLNHFEFLGSTAPDGLAPHIEVLFTPPADFED